MSISFPSSLNQFLASATYSAVAKLDSNHYVIAYQDPATGNGRAVVCSVSGTTITLGTVNTFIATNCSSQKLAVTGTDSTHFVIVYGNSSDGLVYAISGVTDGGTVISSYGTAIALSVTDGQNFGKGVCTLDSTHIVAHFESGSGNTCVTCCSLSGTTLTAGTRVNITTGNIVGSASQFPISTIDSTHFFVAEFLPTNTGQATVGSVSGTTITLGASSNWTTTSARENICTFPIDSTHIGIGWNRFPTDGKGVTIVGTISGTTISSWGSDNIFTSTANSGMSASSIDSSSVILSYNNNTPHGESILGTISGTTMTFGTPTVFDSTDSIDISGTRGSSTAVLDSTHFVVNWVRSTAGTGNSIIGTIPDFRSSNFLMFMK